MSVCLPKQVSRFQRFENDLGTHMTGLPKIFTCMLLKNIKWTPPLNLKNCCLIYKWHLKGTPTAKMAPFKAIKKSRNLLKIKGFRLLMDLIQLSKCNIQIQLLLRLIRLLKKVIIQKKIFKYNSC